MPDGPAIANVEGHNDSVGALGHDQIRRKFRLRQRSRADDDARRTSLQGRCTGRSCSQAPGNLH